MNYPLSFERDGTRWYAVIPEWTGERDELEMVCNADVMCDILAQGDDIVHTVLTTKLPVTYKARLEKIKNTPLQGGATYMCHWSDNFQLDCMEIWLCEVTEFVFGEMPKTIYVV